MDRKTPLKAFHSCLQHALGSLLVQVWCVCETQQGTRWLKWLEREFTDRKFRGSNPTSASRLSLSRLGQPGSIPALVLPWGGMAARHRKAGQFICKPLITNRGDIISALVGSVVERSDGLVVVR
ncbi:hypothetical protein CSKR_110645 [Clonorchis sinensis]|uniref:Uncharacterized protein n=1 Tax=Clonorchis sinensis TaxID=79923 RepID=A0A3R7FCJ1_CLOSI|nr:hypothetical protein CSKR_110645 [Clonorchis sinensis]